MTSRLWTALMVTACVSGGVYGAGCAESGDSEGTEHQAVASVIRDSEAAFIRGNLTTFCSYYTPEAQRAFTAEYGGHTCSQAAKRLREALGGRALEAMENVRVVKVEIGDDVAEATVCCPISDRVEGEPGPATVRLIRIDNDWRLTER